MMAEADLLPDVLHRYCAERLRRRSWHLTPAIDSGFRSGVPGGSTNGTTAPYRARDRSRPSPNTAKINS